MPAMAAPPPGLWTDRPTGSEHDWLAADAPPPRAPIPPHTAPAGPPPQRRGPLRALKRARNGVLALLVTAGLIGGGVFAGSRLDGDETPAASTAALPAVSGRAAQTDVNTIYATASKGVVSVQVGNGSGTASGTGFVLDANGTIVTNAHVVSTARQAQIRFDDGDRPVSARVVGTDPSSDLAVLKVDPADTGRLTPLPLADSDDVRVGDAAIAIGFPLGLDKTATSGIVSGTGRQIEAPNGFSIDEVIQTDAPINPGNSGGPLIDAKGRVVGVNSQIATAGGGNGNVGIGFAVPSNTVREIVPRLQSGQSIERPYLGLSTSASGNGRGVVVAEATAGGPAQRAGLRIGDVVVRVDGEAIAEPDDVAKAIADNQPGDRVSVEVRRGGAAETLIVELANRPERTP